NHVMLAAADTYRAAAQEQLAVWANRLQLDLITGSPGSDPGAVVYDAAQAASARGANALVVDTSGRMHTERNLMAELQKIYRVAAKVTPGAPHCSLLVLDATTGQNGIVQAEAFKATIPIDGVVITKLDTSAKGGIAVAVREQLGLPVFFVGLGENIEDLRVFDPLAYVEGLLPSTDV
ncbi:MAG: signal recognition particle-docking protein FtsY, partial [Lysobacterales bacterium]